MATSLANHARNSDGPEKAQSKLLRRKGLAGDTFFFAGGTFSLLGIEETKRDLETEIQICENLA